jgi:membrane-bound lytic murein transglycosylase F
MGVRVRYLDRQPFYQVLPALGKNHAHLAAAGVAITSARLDEFRFGPAYQMVQPMLAYNTDHRPPRELRDVIGKKLEVVKGSSAVEHLRQLQQRYPKLKWKEVAENDSEGLLSRLADGKIDYVITDSTVLDVGRNFYPNVARAFPVGDQEPLAWVFPRDVDPVLYQRAQEFFMRISYDGTLKRLLERYYGHVNRLDRLDIANFLEQREELLPRFRACLRRPRTSPVWTGACSRARLPGVALGPSGNFAHWCARDDDAHVRNRGPHEPHRPPRPQQSIFAGQTICRI